MKSIFKRKLNNIQLFFSIVWHRFIYKWYWSLRHRTIDKYNIVKIKSLKPGYYDIDTRLLHASFDLLCEFVELEKPGIEQLIEQYEEPWRSGNKEIVELYKWWRKVRPQREKHSVYSVNPPPFDFEKNDDKKGVCRRVYNDEQQKKLWDEACQLRWKLEEEWDKEDTENFIRLVKVRGFLWT